MEIYLVISKTLTVCNSKEKCHDNFDTVFSK
jgi:hypothetical protein